MRIPTVGDVVASKYQLDARIGSGGFAVVYRARDLTIGRAVAVKILKPKEHGYDLALASRFAREARAVAALTDEHTIRMFDFGRADDGLLYMVFELLGGQDLEHVLAQHGPMAQRDVEYVLRQVLTSLREAHAVGLIHRDIKPANIRIYEYQGDPWRVKVMDFGIARQYGGDAVSVTRTGVVVGTPRYMSPEQIDGAELSTASDIYSLGLIVHEMLTGSKSHLRDDIAAGRDVDLVATGRLARVLRRMLALDPAERYADAKMALADLDVAERPFAPVHPPLNAQPPPPSTTLPGSHETKPTRPANLPAMLLIAAIVVIGGLAVVWSQQRSGTSNTPVVRANERAFPHGLLRSSNRDEPSSGERDASVVAEDVTLPDYPRVADGCGVAVAETGVYRPGSLIDGQGRKRWITYVPKGYDPEKRHVTVFLFHTDGGDPGEVLSYTKFPDFADEHDLLVVAPRDPDLLVWRDGELADQMTGVFDATRAEFCIDERRVVAAGFGTGGAAVDRVSCMPWVTATITASWRARVGAFQCNERAVPRLDLSPLRSRHLPVDGGRACVGLDQVISLSESERMWHRRNRCTGEKRVVFRAKSGECFSWDCEASYTTCHIDGGHGWPGADGRRAIDMFSCDGSPADFPHNDVIANFLGTLD